MIVKPHSAAMAAPVTVTLSSLVLATMLLAVAPRIAHAPCVCVYVFLDKCGGEDDSTYERSKMVAVSLGRRLHGLGSPQARSTLDSPLFHLRPSWVNAIQTQSAWHRTRPVELVC